MFDRATVTQCACPDVDLGPSQDLAGVMVLAREQKAPEASFIPVASLQVPGGEAYPPKRAGSVRGQKGGDSEWHVRK